MKHHPKKVSIFNLLKILNLSSFYLTISANVISASDF